MQQFITPFCKACSLQKEGQKPKCNENYYPELTFYNFEKFMSECFHSCGHITRVDLWTYYPKIIVFIEMRVSDWFIDWKNNESKITDAHKYFQNKIEKSITYFKQYYQIDRGISFCIVFSKKLVKYKPDMEESLMKDFIRKHIICGGFIIDNKKIASIVCQCDMFKEEIDKYCRYKGF